MVRSQIWRKAVEAWTGDIQAKFGGRSDRVHWSYSDIVFYGEGWRGIIDVEPLRAGPLTII